MDNGVVLPLFYLPPIEYFNAIKTSNDNIIIEKHEHFPKQTYRNRARILSPNGVLDLIIPVMKGSKVHTAVKDVKISYEFNWQRIHWLSLQTCYRSSAFFEFYEDYFAVFYERKTSFLFDYNYELLQLLLKLTKIKANIIFTDQYHEPKANDLRLTIHPKKSGNYSGKPYFQLFEKQNAFVPNLSIVDLLFNQGNQSLNYV